MSGPLKAGADEGLNFWDRRTGPSGRLSGGTKGNEAGRLERAGGPASGIGESRVDRSQKQALIADLHETLKRTGLVVVTHHAGMKVSEVTGLRRKMREAGAGFKVTKNRLARLALKDTGFEGLSTLFRGPTAIAYSADPVAAAKVAVNFANSNAKLAVVGGAMGGRILDAAGVKALAALPSLDELRGRLVGLLQTPASRIAMVLKAPAAQLARVLGAYASKGDAS